MASLITVNMDLKHIKPKNGTDFTLDELRNLIGCNLIEIIHIGEGTNTIMVVDEEGAINGSVLNKLVSSVYGHPIFGNVVVCKESEVK